MFLTSSLATRPCKYNSLYVELNDPYEVMMRKPGSPIVIKIGVFVIIESIVDVILCPFERLYHHKSMSG